MGKPAVIEKLEKPNLKSDIPDFRVGDTVRVHRRITEATEAKKGKAAGIKERVQMFTGTVIARTGTGLSETFSLHRVAYGEGMEQVFLLHNPRIVKIEVMKEGVVRRSKLYYLRGKTGKATRIKGRVRSRNYKGNNAAAVQQAAPAVHEGVEHELLGQDDNGQE